MAFVRQGATGQFPQLRRPPSRSATTLYIDSGHAGDAVCRFVEAVAVPLPPPHHPQELVEWAAVAQADDHLTARRTAPIETDRERLALAARWSGCKLTLVRHRPSPRFRGSKARSGLHSPDRAALSSVCEAHYLAGDHRLA
jgi:hypothetical protein